jgi:hypothetical protein
MRSRTRDKFLIAPLILGLRADEGKNGADKGEPDGYSCVPRGRIQVNGREFETRMPFCSGGL